MNRQQFIFIAVGLVLLVGGIFADAYLIKLYFSEVCK